MRPCPECGSENAVEARFCSACGTPLDTVEDREHEVRKTVSIVFADVTGSTALGEQLDPEATRRLMARYFETARSILEHHGGTVEKFIGDAVMAVFGVPQLHEDDALRAVRAAAELRERITEVQLRTGVNSGEVVAGGGETLVTGDPVNVAARLQQAAQPGDVLIGGRTLELVREAVEVEALEPIDAKGKGEPVVAHRLVRVREGAEPFARRLDAPLVGRARELRLLHEAFERSVEERSCHLFTLLGTAGIGKSRLTQEFVADAGGRARVLGGRCLPYGEGITYWPLVEILRELGNESELARYLDPEPDARVIVNNVLGAVGMTDEGHSPEEAFWAFRKLFETLAREQPLVAVLDDLQWAEPTLLDLVEHVADWSREAPILLLCVARPELLDARPRWGGGKLNATSLFLEPLSEDETDALIDNLFARVTSETRARIAEASEGNPLFVEQMLAMLTEESTTDAALEVPPTIQALLAARLDRLPRPERAVLDRAAVIGAEFSRTAIEELGAEGSVLPQLVRKELIRPGSQASGDDNFRFRHLLVRDAVYDSISKELRAELHERFADWTQGQRSEFDEVVGYHLEQAYRYREQLGDLDDALAERAASRLAAAGRRAIARGDVHAVANLLTRAVALLPKEDPEAIELLLPLSEALYASGETAQAAALLEEGVAGARAIGARGLELRTAILAATNRFWLEPEGATEALERTVEDAIPELERLGDDHGLAVAWEALQQVYVAKCQAAAMGAAADRALFHARRAGDKGLEDQAQRTADWAIWLGPTPAKEALSQLGDRLDEAASNSAALPNLFVLADLQSQVGNAAEARRLAASAHERFEELGQLGRSASFTMVSGWIDLRAGEIAAAETRLRPAYERLKAIGIKGAECGVAGALAEVLYQQGRYDEAEALTGAAEASAASEDVLAQIWWRGVRAKVLALRGEAPEAITVAREAVELSEPSDHPVMKAQAFEALGETLHLLANAGEARTALERAVELYQAKGDVADAARLRERLQALQPSLTQ